MPGGFAEVGVLADFASLIEQSDTAGLSIEAFAGKVVTSSRTASRAMVDFMKVNGASADQMKAAAAETAAAWDATYGQLSRGAKAQADAALMAARAAKEGADQQSAAYAQTAAAARDAEAVQKAAADAAAAAAAKAAAAAEASAKRVTAAGKTLGTVGKWALFGGAVAVAGSVDSAAKLQTAMERLATQAQVPQDKIKGLTQSVMGMSGALATAPNQLAASLYHVESGGIHGANALKVMATAAKEAKVSGADLVDTTTALTAAVYSGIQGAQSYAKAMGLLNATVGAGDMTFQNLDEALGGPMLATVKGYGLSLKDVGAALATFGDLNIRGADAATQLRMAVQYMAKPAATAGPILQKLGLSTTSFADAMSKGGLLPALQLLHDKLEQAGIPAKDYAQVTSDIFSKKGAAGVTILLNSLDKLEQKHRAVGKGTNQVNSGWVAWNKTLQADLDHLKATVQSLADQFGTYLIPKLEAVAHAASDVISWFEKNKGAAEALGGVIAGVLGGAVTAFAVQKAAKFVDGLQSMWKGAQYLIGLLPGVGAAAQASAGEVAAAGDEMVAAADTTATGVDAALASTGIGAVMVALGVAATEMATHWGTVMSTMKDAVNVMVEGAESALNGLIGVLNEAISVFNSTIGHLTGDIGRIRQVGVSPVFGGGARKPGASANDLRGIAETPGGLVKVGSGKPGAVNYKTSEFPATENTFIQLLAAKLGYSPAVIAAWANAEQPPGEPANSANPYNFLNIGENGTTYRGSPTNIWQNPVTAAQAAYQWIETGRGVPGWGASGVGSIKGAAGGSIAEQISAIQHSGWVGGPGAGLSYPDLPADVQAVIGSGTGLTFKETSSKGAPSGKGSSILKSIQNLGSGSKIPTSVAYEAEKSLATQIADQTSKAQAVGQAQVTVLQAINTQLQDKGAAAVQKLTDLQSVVSDRAASQITAMKDAQQAATDKAAEQVTALKDQQTITDQKSAIQVQAIKDQTQVIQDTSALQVAAINASATQIADASNAAATLIGDNAQTNADTINERGLYGLKLVAQQLQVVADQTKAGFDQQIATAQAQLDKDQGLANIANAQAQLATDQVTATQTGLELAAQQNLNIVTLKQSALEAKAQQHLDAVTAKQDAHTNAAKVHVDTVTMMQDARANAAKAHLDAATISQDSRILKATQHADSVQLSVDVTKIGPAQTAVDLSANASKTVQNEMAAQLNLATAQGNVQINQAQLALANTTASANDAIAKAQNQYQVEQNSANLAIQRATDQYTSAQDQANQAIQTATGQYQAAQNAANEAIQQATANYQSAQDAANLQIAAAAQTQAQTAANWAAQLAYDQGQLSGIQGQAAQSEAQAQGAVTQEQALASTQFAGSGLIVNVYGLPANDASAVGEAASWAIRTAGLATV